MRNLLYLLLFIFTSLLPLTLLARTSIAYLDGSTYDIGDSHRSTLHFVHYSAWKYGDNYFFFDTTNPFSSGTFIYGEWLTRLSINKIFNKQYSLGPITDFMPAFHIEMSGSGFRAYLYGLGLPLKIPGFDVAGLNVFVRDNPKNRGSTYQFTPYWAMHFSLGRVRLLFYGHADIAGNEGPSYHANQLFQPYLLCDLGNFWHHPNAIYTGVRYNYWHNSQGTRLTENAIELVVQWFMDK